MKILEEQGFPKRSLGNRNWQDKLRETDMTSLLRPIQTPMPGRFDDVWNPNSEDGSVADALIRMPGEMSLIHSDNGAGASDEFAEAPFVPCDPLLQGECTYAKQH